MKKRAIALCFLLPANLVSMAEARPPKGCAEGTVVTAAGKIKKAFQMTPDKWWIIIADRKNNRCHVEDVYSDKAFPTNCVAGSTVTATGALEENEGEEMEIWNATSIKCTP